MIFGHTPEWEHDEAVRGALFTRDESRFLSWSGDRGSGAVKLWDAALKNIDLTPAQRIVELEVRSAAWLSPAGLLTSLESAEWIAKVCSPDYKAIQHKIYPALLIVGDCKTDNVPP